MQGLAEAIGIDEPITSPSFALAQHYSGSRGALVHLDLYRLEQPAAADELLAQEEETARELEAVLAVEWPERLSRLPAGCLAGAAQPAGSRRSGAGTAGADHAPRACMKASTCGSLGWGSIAPTPPHTRAPQALAKAIHRSTGQSG